MSHWREMSPRRILQSFALRCTPGRKSILQILLQSEQALTQDQIADRLARRRRPLNKVTIYRSLECFLRAGLVHQAYQQDRIWHYELAHRCGKTQCHPHFSCYECGRTFCLPEVSVPLATGLRAGFVLVRQKVRLEGLCPDCQQQPADVPAESPLS
ncbi:MAG: transcriptional repressor [Sedimentisphaerales bacterium]|nr:transcriptional repressor [Sedimentisphaerales bacterium]